MKSPETKAENTSLWIIFLLWPVAALLESMKNYREVWAKNGLLLFIVFFGFTFVAREGQDSIRYIEHFNTMHRSGTGFHELKEMLYSESSGYLDIYQPLVTFIVSRFTGDHRLLFAVYALVFGYFYTRNIWILLDRTKESLTIYPTLFIVVFALVVPFWFINGVRFWTAAHVFLYGTLIFLLYGKRSGLLIAALSVLVHYSYIFPVAVVAIYWLTGNRTTIFLIFFIAGSFISEINIPAFRGFMISHSPAIFHGTIRSYTGESYVEKMSEGKAKTNWYVTWHRKALNIALVILLSVIFFSGKEIWAERRDMRRLFSFLLLFGGFANLLSSIPSFDRYVTVQNLFAAAFIFLYLYHLRHEVVSKVFLLILSPAFALFFLVSLRVAFDSIGVFALIANPIIAPFLTNEMALIDLIK